MTNTYDDDDSFETVIGIDGKPTRILRDGARLRIPLTMRDSVLGDQRRGRRVKYDPAGRLVSWEEEEMDDSRSALHDGRGNYDTVGHRPSFIVSDRVPLRRSIYDEYDRRKSAEWVNPPTSPWARDAEGYAESDIGTACTVKNEDYPDAFGSPGTVRRVKGRGIICVPDRRAAPDPASDRRSVADEYRLYVLRQSPEWRNPK